MMGFNHKEETMKCLKSLILIASCLSSFALYPQEEGRRQTVIDGIAVSHGLVLRAVGPYLWEDRGIGKAVGLESIRPVVFGSEFDWQRLEAVVRVVRLFGSDVLYSCRLDAGSVVGSSMEEVDVVECERDYGNGIVSGVWN